MEKLKERLYKHVDLLIERYPKLEVCREDIIKAYLLLEESYDNGGKLLIAGNGGSAADSEHIVGELMKGFKMPRHLKTDFKCQRGCGKREPSYTIGRNLNWYSHYGKQYGGSLNRVTM